MFLPGRDVYFEVLVSDGDRSLVLGESRFEGELLGHVDLKNQA